MKAVHKIVAGLAVAGLAVSAATAARPDPSKKVTTRVDETNPGSVAAAAVAINYSTGFENTGAAGGYNTLGYIAHVDGFFPAGCGSVAAPCWGHTTGAGFSLITPTISTINPAGGTQHLRVQSDPTTRTNAAGFGLGVDARFPRTAFLSVGPVAPNSVSVDVAVDAPFGSSYRVQPQSNSQGFLATSMLMYNSGSIYILDDLCGAIGLGFIPTDTFWDTLGGYQNYTVAMDPCAADTITYSYGGLPLVLNGNGSCTAALAPMACCTGLGTGTCFFPSSCTYAGTNLEQFLIFSDNFPAPEGFVGAADIDNLVMATGPNCPAVCGDGRITVPTEQCDPALANPGCNPGHTCGAVGAADQCLCSRICTLDAPCVLNNGANGPFKGPFDAAYGGIFIYNAPAGVGAVSVELCGSTGVDTFIAYWGSCSDPADPGSSNDDCDGSAAYGAGSDPSASCYVPGNIASPYPSCTCHDNPLDGDNCYLLQTNGANNLTGTYMIEVNKKATCGGGHLGACCDTNNREGGDPVGCTDNVLAGDCVGVDKVWSENLKCANIRCECIPNCTGRTCGDDGCGGTCGPCGDALACNGVDTCDAAGQCNTGPVPNCDDGVNCTVDTCVEPGGTCSNAPNNQFCSDNNVCDGIETCSPTLGCLEGGLLLCDNDLYCDGVESCDPILGCQDEADPCDPASEECDEVKNQCEPSVIPTVSEWGLVVLTLMLLIGAKVYFGRRQVIA